MAVEDQLHFVGHRPRPAEQFRSGRRKSGRPPGGSSPDTDLGRIALITNRGFDRFMSDDKPSLATAMRTEFAPTLRRDGFSGSGQRYWRVLGGQCQIVEAQGSRYGGKFAINMGVQPISVPLRSGDAPEARRLKEMNCMFRRRLAAEEGDQWWDYEPSQASLDEAVRQACAVYEQVGKAQLDSIAEPGSPINTLTAEAFAARAYNFHGFGNTGILMALTLAQVRKAAGNNKEAAEFARVALEEIGDGPAGSGLKAELHEFLEYG